MLLEVSLPSWVGSRTSFLPYHLRNSSQLKTIEDALKIRRKVLGNLEIAALPNTTPEERKKLLNFVVCGGGPTGVEFASELYDMISEDVMGECELECGCDRKHTYTGRELMKPLKSLDTNH